MRNYFQLQIDHISSDRNHFVKKRKNSSEGIYHLLDLKTLSGNDSNFVIFFNIECSLRQLQQVEVFS